MPGLVTGRACISADLSGLVEDGGDVPAPGEDGFCNHMPERPELSRHGKYGYRADNLEVIGHIRQKIGRQLVRELVFQAHSYRIRTSVHRNKRFFPKKDSNPPRAGSLEQSPIS